MKIQPRYLTLDDLLKNRLFRIPVYQRAYSWDKKQRADLFGDIRATASGSELTHFMATVVGLKREIKQVVTDEFVLLDVVDGQQRLTTLVILLKCIELALDHDDAVQGRLAAQLRGQLVKQDDASLLLLQSNHDYKSFFCEFVRNGTIPDANQVEMLADRAMADAIKECQRFVRDFNDPVRLTAVLKNRLAFILHEIEDEASVYTVFEVLNSRGLAVPWLDRLKSMLMAVAFEDRSGNKVEHIEELHNIWKRIYRCIGRRQGLGSEAVRFAATLWTRGSRSRLFGEADAVAALRDRANSKAAGAIEVSRWLERVTGAVDHVLSERGRSAVTRIGHARLLAVAVSLSEHSSADRERILDQWERTTFRVFGMSRRDARTGVGDYVRLAQEVFRGLTADSVLGELRKVGAGQFSTESAVKELFDTNCYEGWEEALRYFMFAYEEHLAKEAGQRFSNEQWERLWEASAAKSIEHIHPQSRGANVSVDTGIFVHRLGNLTLLPPGLNSQLQDKPANEKFESYRSTGLLGATEVSTHRGQWDRAAVEDRENRLIEWAKIRWADC